MTKLKHALALAARGFKVFPIKAGVKAPPLLLDWPAKASSDVDVVGVLWGKWPDANIGVHCANLLVIDADVKSGGLHSYDMLCLTEEMPATLTSITPTGGKHVFYRLPEGHPGVPNTVGVLGPGLDIRSTGGYVVAPGSTVEAGEYRLEADAEIAPAPDWLVQKLGMFKKREQPVKLNVSDAPDFIVERATSWLRTAPRSVKGAGGDQTAYAVACGLRDQGVSYQQACQLMRSAVWNYGCGWREGRLEEKPIRSAYRYAQNDPGDKVAMPGDFPAVAVRNPAPSTNGGQAAPVDIPGGPARLLGDIAAGDARGTEYLVKGMLSRRSYAELFGPAGVGKTFVALDLAYHVAAGKPWMGRKVWQGPVLYLAYEGVGGLANRCRALQKQYGTDQVPFYLHSAGFNLRDKTGRQALGCLLATLPEKPSLIVIDTFARALMGGDENSAQDVGAFNQSVAALIEETGACVLIIHHTGKNKTAGARGSSALLAAVDTELEIEDGRIVTNKQRDTAMAEPIGFSLVPIQLGKDRDGEHIYSCVVASSNARPPRKEALKGNSKRGFRVLCDLSPNNAPVSLESWREACAAFLPARSLTSRFWDMKDDLERRKMVTIDAAKMVTRKMEG